MFRLDCYSSDDKNDCTVRTLSKITGMGYQAAHDVLSFYGRKPNEGFVWQNLMRELQKEFVEVYDKYSNQNLVQIWQGKYLPKRLQYRKTYTVSQALKKFNKGKFAFLVHGHVFAVLDGVVHDTFRSGKHMKHVLAVYQYRG